MALLDHFKNTRVESKAQDIKKPIRVFLVDDSPIALVILKRMLATSSEVMVVGTACNGREALKMFESTQPEVICTDYHMPDMDGLALIQETMAVFPRPILVISSTIDPAVREKAFPLLAAGAVDVFAKPDASTPFEKTAQTLVKKIKILAGVVVISRRPTPPQSKTLTPAAKIERTSNAPIQIAVIGASTGGPQVLQTILTALPANFTCPILCVQHISSGFLHGLVTWLNEQSKLRIKIADNGEIAMPGTVYFPQENTHLEINRRGCLTASTAPPVDGHRPSVTVTFESAARAYSNSCLAVLLTGMGSDGASGLLSVAQAEGTTLVQNEESCVVFGMPKQAVAIGAAQHILSPEEIAAFMIRLVKSTEAI